jgi:nitroimidazol reductase NimA-like FMN-containing flavoprotein (pyridoxamine 5'-phosphate oxidase superfamily)
MIAIEEMSNGQIKELLKRIGYGHLGVTRGTHPYVVPIHFAYDDPYIYIYTTEGKKTEIIRDNPEICLQVEDIRSDKDWESVIVTGEAARITGKEERERALEFILAVNPTLTPAISIRWMDSWVRENVEVIYRIMPRMLTGRATIEHADAAPEFSEQEKRRKSTIY